MKKIYLKYFAFILVTLIAASCSNNEKYIAPASLKGYIISYYLKESTKLDAGYINTTTFTEYKKNGTYEDTINGQAINLGSYTYHRTKYNVGTVIVSYSDDSNQHGLDNYQTILTFTDPSNGTFYSSFDIDTRSRESGIFHIVRHGE